MTLSEHFAADEEAEAEARGDEFIALWAWLKMSKPVWEHRCQIRSSSTIAMYRDDVLGVQKEVTTDRYGTQEVFFYRDNDPRTYNTEDELIRAIANTTHPTGGER